MVGGVLSARGGDTLVLETLVRYKVTLLRREELFVNGADPKAVELAVKKEILDRSKEDSVKLLGIEPAPAPVLSLIEGGV